MADEQQSINIAFVTTGADKALKQSKNLQEVIDQLTKSEDINAKAAQRLSQQNQKVEKSLQKMSSGFSQASGAAQKATTNYSKWSAVQRDFGGVQSTTLNLQKNINDTVAKGLTAQNGYGTAVQTASHASSTMASNLPRLRYALYDVSTTFAIAGAAALGLGAAVAATSIQMDSQFANVARTTGTYLDSTGAATQALRKDFNDLYTSIPTSFSDLAEIGTLAGQLGVASENVAEFTSLVAKFSATTDVSVEQSATAFGRLSELLDVSASQYENLGSSILAVGVASVATESQIIAISSQIASIGSFAGLTAAEVIGLSSALASLGIQPELARGTLTRLFTNISKSISEGGENLERFNQISGTDFAKSWGDDAAGALVSLLRGLDGVGSSNGIAALNSLGITAARDVPALLKLAQNSELVAEQLQIAGDGFANGTALQEQYGVIAETTASQLTILANGLKLLISNLGDTDGVFKDVIAGLSTIVAGLAKMADNSVFQAVTGITLAFVALGGVLLLVSGGLARGAASALAIKGALIDAATAAGVFGNQAATAALVAEKGFLRTALAIKGIRTALISTGIGAILAILGTAAAYFVGQMDQASQHSKELADSFGGALKTDFQVWKDGADDVETFDVTVENANYTTEVASQKAGELAESMTGVESNVQDATAAVETYTGALGDATKAAIDAALNSFILGDGSGADQLKRVQDLQRGLELMGVSYEDFSRAVLENDVDFLSQVQLDSLDLLDQKAQDAGVSVKSLAPATYDALQGVNALAGEAVTAAGGLSDAKDEAAAAAIATEITGVQAEKAAGDLTDLGIGADGAGESLSDFAATAFDSINGIVGLNDAVYNLGASLYENGGSFDAFTASGRENLGALEGAFSAASAAAAGDSGLYKQYVGQIISAMVATGQVSVATIQGLADQGVDLANVFVDVSNKGVEALNNLIQATRAGRAQIAANSNIGGYGQSMALQESQKELDRLTNAYENATVGSTSYLDKSIANINKTNPLLDQLGQGWDSAGDKATGSGKKQSDAAKKIAKEVRTLSDYVSDLKSVFADAFEFRFGFQQATDDVLNSTQSLKDYFSSLRDDIDKNRSAIRDYRTEIQGLKADMLSLAADRDVLKYQLRVAVEYGDTLRANEIRGELAQNAAEQAKKANDLADKQKELDKTTAEVAEAQKKLKPQLTGTTEGAIEQREAVLELVQSYEDQIAAYANTGASQKDVAKFADQLKTKLKEQLTQLGYNTSDVKKYTAALGDVKTIIAQIPRNLTVKADANTSPAEKALREFKSKAKTDGTASGKNFASGFNSGAKRLSLPKGGTVKFTSSFNDAGAKKAARAAKLVADLAYQTAKLTSAAANGASSYELNSRRDAISSIGRRLASGNYWDGGYTGSGGKYEPAGVVHKGEYVIPKSDVNQATGLPYADAFNRLSRGVQSAPSYATGGSVTGGGVMMVELSPVDRRLLKAAGDVQLAVNGRVLAQTVNGYNKQQKAVGS